MKNFTNAGERDHALFFEDGKLPRSTAELPPLDRVTKLVMGSDPIEESDQKNRIVVDVRKLEEFIGSLPRLTHLYLWGLRELPSLPPLPEGLICLDLRQCSAITSLPAKLPESLRFLDLAGNRALTQLPDRLPSQLSELYLRNCSSLKLTGFAQQLRGVRTSLEVLDLFGVPGNVVLPHDLLDSEAFPKLRDLRVGETVTIGNDIAGADLLKPYLRSNALEALQAWWRDLRKSGGDTTPFIKVFLLGNGQAGKTQVRHFLKGDPLNAAWDSTHGAQLATVPPGQGPLKLPDLGLALWDFGGQDIYHGTHALFTDAGALYVLVWTGDPNRQGERWALPKPESYWLEYIAALSKPDVASGAGFGSQTPCRVVITESGVWPSRAALRCPVPGRLDARVVGHDLDPKLPIQDQERRSESLVEAIRSQALKVLADHPATIPKSWVQLRETLRSPAIQQERILSEKRFETLCRDAGIGESKTSASKTEPSDPLGPVRRYLHQCGALFHRPGLFDGRVVVNQQWAFDAIYAVLDRRDVNPLRQKGRDGSFTRQELQRSVWEGKNLDETEARLLIEMMEQCGICFRWGVTASEEKRYLAPELLPKKSELESNLLKRLETAYPAPLRSQAFRYEFLHEGILRGTMSKAGEKAGTEAVYWKGGFCVHEWETNTFLVVEAKQEDESGRGCIQVKHYGPPSEGVMGPWNWIVGLLGEHRPMPDPGDLEKAREWEGQASQVKPAVVKGGLFGRRGAHERPDTSGESRMFSPRFGGCTWEFLVHEADSFEQSRKVRVGIQKWVEGGAKPCGDEVVQDLSSLAQPGFEAELQQYLDQAGLAAFRPFEDKAAKLGEDLFWNLVDPKQGTMLDILKTYLDACKHSDGFLRFRFSGGPEFHAVPWEAMREKDGKRLGLRHSILRQLRHNDQPLPVAPKDSTRLKVLWVTARPRSTKGEADWGPSADAVFGPVHKVVAGAGIEIKRIENGSLNELKKRLDRETFHIVHLDLQGRVVSWEELMKWDRKWVELGERGALDPIESWEGKRAVLAFAKDGLNSKIVPVTAEDLAKILTGDRSVPLVVLNACKSGTVPAGSMALPAYLAKAGMVGVLGFQGYVTVAMAELFFAEFYRTLSPAETSEKFVPGDVEAAVRKGREALSNRTARGQLGPGKLIHQKEDWWVPVYYATGPLRLFSRDQE